MNPNLYPNPFLSEFDSLGLMNKGLMQQPTDYHAQRNAALQAEMQRHLANAEKQLKAAEAGTPTHNPLLLLTGEDE